MQHAARSSAGVHAGRTTAKQSTLLHQIEPDGQDMARDLERLLTIKDDAHYGMLDVSAQRAKTALRQARRLLEAAAGYVR